MRFNILIGGQAGQGINKTSEIISNILAEKGYYTFNYKEYPSLIRGGHNFNILSVSDKPIESHEIKLDIIIALNKETIQVHKNSLKKQGIIINSDNLADEKENLNIALAGALIKILGFSLEDLNKELKKQFKENKNILESGKKGFNSQEYKKENYSLKKLSNKISILSGSQATSIGAIKSGIDLYIAYPMTPATELMHELAKEQLKNNLMVFQPENEIAVANMALGASFAGSKTLIGTSGGGFDLMSEALSFQGISGIPLTVYLASRPGPGTGVPTYTNQPDLDIALRAGHGEFSRVVIAPSNAVESIEKTSEALFLAEKFKTLSIILTDKHLAESEYSLSKDELSKIKTHKIQVSRDLPGKNKIVKSSSYESNKYGNTTESAELTEKNTLARIEKYEKTKQFIENNFEMIKIYGNKNSKNLIIGWGSTSGAIKDAIQEIESNQKDKLDAKFLQVLYLKPLSGKIKKEMENAKNIILIEQNVTGQLGRLLREKTGISIPEKNRILKFNGRPFTSNELKTGIQKRLI